VKAIGIIDNPDADPHDYEPTAADARAVASVRYAIVNGIGYDVRVPELLAANPGSDRTVLTIGDPGRPATGPVACPNAAASTPPCGSAAPAPSGPASFARQLSPGLVTALQRDLGLTWALRPPGPAASSSATTWGATGR
jgi:hypothetical protein